MINLEKFKYMKRSYKTFDSKEKAKEYVNSFGSNRPDISFGPITEIYEGIYQVEIQEWPLD